MVENRPWLTGLAHAVLLAAVLVVCLPIWIALVGATHREETLIATVPMWFGPAGFDNFRTVLSDGARSAGGAPVGVMLFNSLLMALAIAAGKIAISIVSAFAIVYFRFPLRMVCFWIVFLTLMLPVEVRILPTFKVAADLGMLDSYWGLTVPLLASATATFLFRQFFLTIPDELTEAARIDGAGPLRFFRDVVVPLSRTNIAALFVILFIYGWNQYLWPLLITTREDMYTVVMGIQRMVAVPDAEAQWHLIMATAMLALLPPVAVVVAMQRLFVKGLVETEK